MDTTTIINSTISILSLLALIIGAIAELRWSKHFKEAKEAQLSEKDEQLKTKESQIGILNDQLKFYKELTPKVIKEHFTETTDTLNAITVDLKNQLIAAKSELKAEHDKIDDYKHNEEFTEDLLQTDSLIILKNEERIKELETILDDVYKLTNSLTENEDSMIKTITRGINNFIIKPNNNKDI